MKGAVGEVMEAPTVSVEAAGINSEHCHGLLLLFAVLIPQRYKDCTTRLFYIHITLVIIEKIFAFLSHSK